MAPSYVENEYNDTNIYQERATTEQESSSWFSNMKDFGFYTAITI